MNELKKLTVDYLDYCYYQKNLNPKTIKAYSIDLKQFVDLVLTINGELNKNTLTQYITHIHKRYKPKTIKRKIACVKAFLNYMEYEEILEVNPFKKLRVKFKEPLILPRTIPINYIQDILSTAYAERMNDSNSQQQLNAVYRDIAVLELLFATGVRVSELCCLYKANVDLDNNNIRIFGKGSRERIVQIGNQEVISALIAYYNRFSCSIHESGFFFVNRLHHRLSEQSVRFMINKYVEKAGIAIHITPHMFRHSFATLLLEEDVDIRYIQQLLGHSSITTTQIYTHVTSTKQKSILITKHPRNKIVINKG